MVVRALSSLCILCALCGELSGLAADWPQLQNGPQRLGYSPEKVDLPLKVAWRLPFSPERLHPQAQPVIAEGKVFIGTEMAVFHAFDAQTGKEVWQIKAGGPILHTAGVAGGQVFFACLDGKVYARKTADGAEVWTSDSSLPTGFSTAVLLAEGNVYAANRGGTYFALSQKDGSVVWRRELGVPLLMSSAYNDGLLFLGAMDMRCYALDAKTGQVRWKSEVLPGAAFKDYWPVACQGYVLLRPMRSSSKWTGPAIEWQTGPLPETELAKQEKRIENITKSGDQDFFVLNQTDGKEAFVVPHWTSTTMNGAVAPPCVDGDGLLIVPVIIHDWRGGWGRLDLAKRRVVELLCEGPPAKDAKGQPAGMGNGDENMIACAAGRLAFVLHTQEGNANYTGVWQLDRRKWAHIMAAHADRMFSSNTQGGGANPGAVAGGMLYHTSCNTLNARKLTVVGGP